MNLPLFDMTSLRCLQCNYTTVYFDTKLHILEPRSRGRNCRLGFKADSLFFFNFCKGIFFVPIYKYRWLDMLSDFAKL